jgi:tripartite-type tricarboxylate transporter receptor subunit TctC
MEFYKVLTGARMIHIPYGGNAPAVQSLVAGQTHAFITPIAGVLQHVRAGKLRALAVTSAQRSPVLPDVPTFVELGQPRFIAVAWFNALVPIKTPDAVVDALHRELVRVLQLPEIREQYARLGQEPAWGTGQAVVDRARGERKLWAEVIEKSGMKVE